MVLFKLLVSLTIIINASNACSNKWKHTVHYSSTTAIAYNRNTPPTGYCFPSPYIPGGAEIVIESFDAPKAEMQYDSIANIAKYMGFACDATSDVSDIAALAGKALKSCEKLGASLGIMGTVFGFLSSATSPTTQDILDSVNRAIADLTKEVNDQFTNMQGYVDSQLLVFAKNRWEDTYEKYFNAFTTCTDFDAEGEPAVIQCMQSVEHESGSDQATFMDYKGSVDDPAFKPATSDIKHMEVQFNVYRNFVHLRMTMLLTLYGALKDKTDEASRGMCKTYLTKLRDESVMYKSYTDFCYNAILGAYEGFDGSKWSGSIVCANQYNQCEGGSNTATYFDCSTQFDTTAFLASQTCNYQAKIRVDGHQIPGEYLEDFGSPFEKHRFATHMYDLVVRPYWKTYHQNLTAQVKAYWEPTVLTSQETLQQINDGAVEKLKDYATVEGIASDVYLTSAHERFSSALMREFAAKYLQQKGTQFIKYRHAPSKEQLELGKEKLCSKEQSELGKEEL